MNYVSTVSAMVLIQYMSNSNTNRVIVTSTTNNTNFTIA